jgi:hypothetical protein
VPSLKIPRVGGGAGFFAIDSEFLMTVFNSNQSEIIRDALQQTELHLADLQGAAASAEARAFNFSSSCILIATLFVAFADRLPNAPTLVLASAVLVMCSIWTLWTVLPRQSHIRGHYWTYWAGHVEDDDPLDRVRISQAEENDQRIEYNIQTLERSAKGFMQAFVAAYLAICFMLGGQIASVVWP